MILFITGIVLQVYLLKVVWLAVYAGRPVVAGVSAGTLIAYLTLANLQLLLLWGHLGDHLHERVREGSVAMDRARPVGFLGQLLARQIGFTLGSLPFLLAALPPGWTPGGSAAAGLAAGALGYGLSLLLGYLVSTLIGLLLGLVTLLDGGDQRFLCHLSLRQPVLRRGSGAALVLPPALRTLADLLPFQTQAHLPLAICFGTLTGPDLLRALGIQAGWVVILVLLARWLWGRAYRRLVIQGR